MAEIDPHLDAILRCLAKHQMCATYGAVAGVYGGSARSIGNSLGVAHVWFLKLGLFGQKNAGTAHFFWQILLLGQAILHG